MLLTLMQGLGNKEQCIKTDSEMGMRTEKGKKRDLGEQYQQCSLCASACPTEIIFFFLFFLFFPSTCRLFSDVLLTNSEKPQFKVGLSVDLLMFVEVSGCGWLGIN